MFGAYPAAFKLNFPKHTNFFPFLMDFRVVITMFFEITLFFDSPCMYILHTKTFAFNKVTLH